MKKRVALALVLVILSCIITVPVNISLAYSEDPLLKKDLEVFGAAIPEAEPASQEVTEPVTEPVQETQPLTIQETEPVQQIQTAQETEPPQESQPMQDAIAEKDPVSSEPEKDTVTAQQEDPNAPKGHNGVPLYFQTDYPNEVYGEGTVASNGCSAACLAMIATYMTGHEYLPDEIARYFGDSAENNIARLENGSEVMQLPYQKASTWYDTIKALKDGKVVVALMNSRSLFTNSQHFIILTGLNSEGKIMVNDSYKPNYDKWDIKNGLRNGFEEGDILLGYEGAWIYDKSAMPVVPFLYSEPKPVRGEPRYGIELTEAEKWFLAKVVWVEARGESREGQQAVAEVILNRLAADGFSDTLQGVVHAPDQFNSAKFLDKAKPYQMQYEAVENALLGPYILPEDVYYFATTPKTSKVWGEIGGHVFCYAEN